MTVRFDLELLENDPEFKRLSAQFAAAKMEFLSYINDKLDTHLIPATDKNDKE